MSCIQIFANRTFFNWIEIVRVRPRGNQKSLAIHGQEFGGGNNLQATDSEIIDRRRRHHFETRVEIIARNLHRAVNHVCLQLCPFAGNEQPAI